MMISYVYERILYHSLLTKKLAADNSRTEPLSGWIACHVRLSFRVVIAPAKKA
jgi:hypothetical protein